MIVHLIELMSIKIFIFVRGLLGDFSLTSKVHALINHNIHFFNENAVSWNSASLINVDDVSNNYILDLNRLACSKCTSVNGNGCVVNLVFEAEILSLLNPVTKA
jgi:hypothetical protein